MAQHSVAIIGAGPASLYAAEKLAKSSVRVAIINRDIKPGGLAEFGIYPNKYKMKSGLRKVFSSILAHENVSYFGNVTVGGEGDLTLEQVRDLGFDAVVVAVGAQGTKWLGLPGEDASSVFHAKDLVYHYNHLPPFSEQDFAIGQNVCVVGIGNVSLDIIHWLVCERKVQTAVAVARRGPAERAYTQKEMKMVSGALDMEQTKADFESTRASLLAVGQDPDELFAAVTKHVEVPLETETDTRFWVRFLRSPESIEVDANGQVTGLRCQVTELVAREDGSMGVASTGKHEVLACDTVVFAIGDSIEPGIGLPIDPTTGKTFAVCQEPWDAHPERPRYMVFDPAKDAPMHGVFVVGWARKASDGLVGKARADAVQGCDEILAYLEGHLGPQQDGSPNAIQNLVGVLENGQIEFVDYDGIQRLEAVEAETAKTHGTPEFKFDRSEDMMKIIREEA